MNRAEFVNEPSLPLILHVYIYEHQDSRKEFLVALVKFLRCSSTNHGDPQQFSFPKTTPSLTLSTSVFLSFSIYCQTLFRVLSADLCTLYTPGCVVLL